MPEQNELDTGKAKKGLSIDRRLRRHSNPAYFANWHTIFLYATWLNGEERAGHWKQHLIPGTPKTSYVKRTLPAFICVEIRKHPMGPVPKWGLYFYWERVLFADVQKFLLDGTALTDTLLEYDNARNKEIGTLRATIDDETVRDALIARLIKESKSKSKFEFRKLC